MKQNRIQTHDRRSRWLADPRLQCGLLARVIMYWMYSVCGTGAIALTWIFCTRHPQSRVEWVEPLWLSCGPLVVGAILILPLILLDCWRFSRRFAGPMVRFRRALHDLAKGHPVDPIELREGDFWGELARDLNRVARRLPTRQPDVQATAAETGMSDVSRTDGARTDGAKVGMSKTAADETFDAMEETVDFVPPAAEDTKPEEPQAPSSLAANSATATSWPPALLDMAPPMTADFYI